MILHLIVIWVGFTALILLFLIVAARSWEDVRDHRQGRVSPARPSLTPISQERAARLQLYPRLRLIDCAQINTPYDHEKAPATFAASRGVTHGGIAP